jgi:hypothetical protein
VVKASKAGRDISLSKLEARLGEYRPRETGVVIENRPKEAVERVNTRGVKSNWERYTAERERYFREKKEAAADLSARQKTERAELQKRQREERERMFSGSWKGRGALLNRQRSVLAATQQAEKLNLRDRHSRERDNLKKLFPIRFPNFKTWLDSKETNQEASVSFRYLKNAALYGMGANAAPTPSDLRAFTPKIGNKGGVAYARGGGKEAEFIDYGKKIVLEQKCDETATLAALQLANQKWGSAVINGTEEYKRLCVELAIRHNLRLANPDLAQEVEEARKRMSQAEEKARRGMEAGKHARNYFSIGAGDPDGAYWAHYRDIISRESGAPDYSRIDGKIGIRMRVTGYSQDRIRSAIETNAPAMRRASMTGEEYDAKYRNRNWARYARETADRFVFGVRGLSQYEKSREYRPRLMKVEGRNPGEEARYERELRTEQQKQEEHISGR